MPPKAPNMVGMTQNDNTEQYINEKITNKTKKNYEILPLNGQQ